MLIWYVKKVHLYKGRVASKSKQSLYLNKKSANRERSLYLIITKVTSSHYLERQYYCMPKYEISEWIKTKSLF
ncbi:hypothetical protein BK729_09815 [Bacillus thuringiensis serovar wratislaviensis]|nr:hypothetical protein BK729_09815 [Bacillus thuringiensis serovar wratislaviensis]OTY21395.1 hypothetical protein BK734_00150 [Bacillus thuringiensis serovar kim]